MKPSWILDLETTGLETAYQASPITTVGISEFALLGPGGKFIGGHTDILKGALSKKLSPQEFHRKLTSGPVQWQSGYSREGDVLQGVFQRHVEAAVGGKATYSEASAVTSVMDILNRDESIMAWNARFDIGRLRRTAQKMGINDFNTVLNQAENSGRVIEASAPWKRMLFNWASEGKVDLFQSSKEAKKKIAFGEWTAKDIDTARLADISEPHQGFKKLFTEKPHISYEQYVSDVLEGDTHLSLQSFGAGYARPDISYVRSWKQHVIAESINPGFMENPLKTKLGQLVAQRVPGATDPHQARFDVGLSQILYEKLSASNPMEELRSLGVESEGQLIGQFKTAREADLRRYLKTYLGENTPRQADFNYLSRVQAFRETGTAAREVANLSGESVSKLPSLKSVYMDAFADAKLAVQKHPRFAMGAAIVGGILLADALVPEDNRLEGRRNPHSKYTRIRGITFEGIGSPAGTDFGSGRLIDNATSAISYRMSQSNVNKTYSGFSLAETEKAQSDWGGALSSVHTRTLDSEEYVIAKAGRYALPGVNQNIWAGVVDLKNYRVKVEDGDTLRLMRRGIWHMMDKPVSVRMAGIDAPETHPRWPFAMQPAGIESGKYLQKIVEQQSTMHLLIDPNRTTYGRNVGILSGNVNPNINLKMVAAGAAAATGNFDGNKGLAAYRAYEQAEAQAATSGLGMWASKGWQAKRMLDITIGARITNTSLQDLQRLGTRAGLAQYHSFVQDLHTTKPSDPWTPESIMAMQYLRQGMSKQDLTSSANNRLKEYGWDKAIKGGGGTSWNTLPFGINPSGINVSAFGSGLSTIKANKIAKMADVLGHYRPKVDLLLEPMMEAPRHKRKIVDMLVRQGDKRTAQQSMKHYIDTTPYPTYIPYKSGSAARPAPVFVSGMKAHVHDAVTASAAATSTRMAHGSKSGWRRSKYIGAVYSAEVALSKQYKPINEYKALKGWGFPGSWQETAWKNFESGNLNPADALLGYDQMLDSLKRSGIDKPDAFLKRRGIYNKIQGMVERQAHAEDVQLGRYTKSHSIWDSIKNKAVGIYKGEPAFGANANLFLANRNALFASTTFREVWKEEYGLLSAAWKGTVTPQKGFWGKATGVIDFLSEDPIVRHAPNNWSIANKKSSGWVANAKNYVFGATPSKTGQAIKSWATANVPTVLKSAGKFGVKRVGGLGIAMGGVFAYMNSSEYENQLAGFGVEFGAEAAGAAAGFVVSGMTSGLTIAAGGKAGALAGAAIGTLFGPGIGNVAGGIIGAAIGAVSALVVSIVAYEAAAYGVRTAGGAVLRKRNSNPYPTPVDMGPAWSVMNAYGGKDAYLEAGHGIQGRPEFSGFGGSLKPAREAIALSDTLGRASTRIVGSALPPTAPVYARTRSRLQPTAGLVNNVLWNNRHRKAPMGPMTWAKRNQSKFANESRMSMAV